MPPPSTRAQTVGASHFVPDDLFADWSQHGDTRRLLPQNNDFRSSIIATFNLSAKDSYVYRAVANVTLSQVQEAISHGAEHGLHAWYRDSEGQPLPAPSQADITAYTSIFLASSAPSKSLTAFASNAKKSSIRSRVASHLLTHRTSPLPACLNGPIAKSKNHVNPALDFWIWSCHNLEWCGPEEGTEKVKTSHHVLPVFMHHFGCVVPSYEALEIIKRLTTVVVVDHTTTSPSVTNTEPGTADKQADGDPKTHELKTKTKTKTKNPTTKPKPPPTPTPTPKEIADIGSGNGYWTYMLRRLGVTVSAVDNLQSNWRTVWISDTIVQDGDKWLQEHHSGAAGAAGGKNLILLLVYPIVGADFTRKVIDAYKGDTVVVVGTQNRNGYTAFADRTVEEWMLGLGEGWVKIIQLPLPSFAGKDEAMFVFQR